MLFFLSECYPESITRATTTTPSLSTAAKTGIGVGTSIGALLLLGLGAIGAMAWLRRRSRGAAQGAEGLWGVASKPELDAKSPLVTMVPSKLEHVDSANELATGNESQELSARVRAVELAVDRRVLPPELSSTGA